MPTDVGKYVLRYEQLGAGAERFYFFILDLLKQTGYKVEKVKDIYSASEASSFSEDMARRRMSRESHAMQILASLNRMVKDLFPIVRDYRIVDERLKLYDKSYKGDVSAEKALKDIWITLVEGGTKNPSSVYGLATQVGFISLPDFFFNINIQDPDKVSEEVNKLKDLLPKKVRDVLERKLKQYLEWKQKTYQELKTRKKFLEGYIKTHINEIRFYLQLAKPYLKDILKLRGEELEEPELVRAFETSKIILELFAWKESTKIKVIEPPMKKEEKFEFKNFIPVIKISFNYTAYPSPVFNRGFVKGYTHVGKVEIQFIGQVYTKEEFEQREKDKFMEDINLLSKVVGESLESLKDYLEKFVDKWWEPFLKEEEKKEEKKEEEKKKRGINEILRDYWRKMFGLPDFEMEKEKELAKSTVSKDLEDIYIKTKKNYGLFAPP